jgi:hypothetical protein
MTKRFLLFVLVAALLLPLGYVGAQMSWQFFHHRYESPETGLYPVWLFWVVIVGRKLLRRSHESRTRRLWPTKNPDPGQEPHASNETG